MENHFIDTAYNFAKKKFESSTFTFKDIWAGVIKETKISKADQEKQVGVLYTDLIQDPRFVYCGNKNWRLKEFVSQAEMILLQNALYDFQPDVVEEGYENDEKYDEVVVPTKEAPITETDEDIEEIYEEMNSDVSRAESEDEDN